VKTSLRKRLWRRVRRHFRSRILARHGVAILAETKNGTLAVDPGDFNVSRQLLTRGAYDWNEVRLLSSLLSPTSRIAVAGAHIGAVLIPVVRMAQIQSAIAYEPSPHNFKLLEMNLTLNGVRHAVQTRNIALGEQAGRASFIENPINTGNSRLCASGGTLEVALDTLDATLPVDWESVDLIVMDIEGAEVRAMRGAQRTLERTRHLYIELAPEQLHEQGSTAEELVDLIGTHFRSAAIMGTPPRYLSMDRLRRYLRELPNRRGLLLNILCSKAEPASAHA
jgi:FkbM family methyltransferase